MHSPRGWSRHASTYRHDSRMVTGPYADIINEMILFRTKAGDVLDVAAGPGEGGIKLAQQAGPSLRVTVSDFAPGMVELAQQRAEELSLPNLSAVVADAMNLPFGDCSFDFVTSNFGIFLIPDRKVGWAEAVRVLRPGGTLISTVWTMPDVPKGFHPIVFSAIKTAKGQQDTQPSVPSAFAPQHELEAELAAIEGIARVHVEKCHTTAVVTASQVAELMVDNPGMKAMINTDEEAASFTKKLEDAIVNISGAQDSSEPLTLSMAAHLVIAEKEK